MSPLTTPLNIGLQVLANAVGQEKEIKGIQIEKEDIKLLLLTDDMIIYVETLKESTNKTSGGNSNYSKVLGYKVNIKNYCFPIY